MIPFLCSYIISYNILQSQVLIHPVYDKLVMSRATRTEMLYLYIMYDALLAFIKFAFARVNVRGSHYQRFLFIY